MVHFNKQSANDSAAPKVLALLPLLLLAVSGFAQGNSHTQAADEGLSRTEIISYLVCGIGLVIVATVAWISGSKKTTSPRHATDTPRLRISSARINDPYMKRKVVKKTS
jgi:hypothetical protein